MHGLESCYFESSGRYHSFDVRFGPGEARLFEIEPFYYQCILHSNAKNQAEEEKAMLILWEEDQITHFRTLLLECDKHI